MPNQEDPIGQSLRFIGMVIIWAILIYGFSYGLVEALS